MLFIPRRVLNAVIFLQPLIFIILQITNVLKTSFSKNLLIRSIISTSARDHFAENIYFFYYRWMFVYKNLLLWMRNYLRLIEKSCFSCSPDGGGMKRRCPTHCGIVFWCQFHACKGMRILRSTLRQTLEEIITQLHQEFERIGPIAETQFSHCLS